MDFSNRKFLGTFNTPEATQAPVAVPPAAPAQAAAPAPAGQPSVPVAALPAIIDATAAAREELARARALQAQVVASQTPVAPPAQQAAPTPAPEKPESDEVMKELRAIKRELADERRARAQAELEAYRQQALGAGRARGLDPAFDLYVGGRNAQEIDASLQVALAEQELARQRWTQQLVQQHGAPPPAQASAPAQSQPPAPVGYVTQVQPAQAAPQEPQINAPSNIQASAPQAQAEGLTPEQLAYLTSSAAIRNGDYNKYRNQIHQALQGRMAAPPNGWTFQNQQQPYGVPQAPAAPAPTQQSVYAGVSFPQVRPMGPLLGPQGSYQGAPGHQAMGHGRAVQPVEIDQQGAQIDVAASRQAAQAAIQAKRAASGNNQSFH